MFWSSLEKLTGQNILFNLYDRFRMSSEVVQPFQDVGTPAKFSQYLKYSLGSSLLIIWGGAVRFPILHSISTICFVYGYSDVD